MKLAHCSFVNIDLARCQLRSSTRWQDTLHSLLCTCQSVLWTQLIYAKTAFRALQPACNRVQSSVNLNTAWLLIHIARSSRDSMNSTALPSAPRSLHCGSASSQICSVCQSFNKQTNRISEIKKASQNKKTPPTEVTLNYVFLFYPKDMSKLFQISGVHVDGGTYLCVDKI